jgi:hypothetical protein
MSFPENSRSWMIVMATLRGIEWETNPIGNGGRESEVDVMMLFPMKHVSQRVSGGTLHPD